MSLRDAAIQNIHSYGREQIPLLLGVTATDSSFESFGWWMSIPALNWAFKVQGLSSSDKFVLVALSDYASEGGLCYPSIQTLCFKTCLNRKTVIRCLDRLLESGHVIDTGKKVGNTESIKVYRLQDDFDGSSPKSGTAQAVPKTDGSSPNFTRKQSQNRKPAYIGTIREPSGEPSVAPRVEMEIPEKLKTPEFAEAWFKWQTYRRTLKKVKDWDMLFGEQLTWLSRFEPPEAVEILNQSLRNGYQGLFQVKTNGVHRNGNGSQVAENILRQTELDRVEAEMKRIKGCCWTQNNGWDDEESKSRHRELRARRDELLKKLGMIT
jgi:hypothetical protein